MRKKSLIILLLGVLLTANSNVNAVNVEHIQLPHENIMMISSFKHEIAYIDNNESSFSVYIYNVDSRTNQLVLTENDKKSFNYLHLMDKYIIWGEKQRATRKSYEMVLYTRKNKTQKIISSPNTNTNKPLVNTNWIVWLGTSSNRLSQAISLYAYNINSGSLTTILDGVNYSFSGIILQDNFVYWSDNRCGTTFIRNFNIYSYDLVNKKEIPVCTSNDNQTKPVYVSDHIIWLDSRNKHKLKNGKTDETDLYAYKISTKESKSIDKTDSRIASISSNSLNSLAYLAYNVDDNYPRIYKGEFKNGAFSVKEINNIKKSTKLDLFLDNELIIWNEKKTDNDYDIKGFDVKSKSEFVIAETDNAELIDSFLDSICLWRSVTENEDDDRDINNNVSFVNNKL